MRSRGQTFSGLRESPSSFGLASGDFGRNVMKLSGICMLLSLASGAYLWWPIKQVRIRRWGGARFWFDMHNAIGIFSLLPLAMLAATGTVLGFEDHTSADDLQADPFQPDPASAPLVREPAPGAARNHAR